MLLRDHWENTEAYRQSRVATSLKHCQHHHTPTVHCFIVQEGNKSAIRNSAGYWMHEHSEIKRVSSFLQRAGRL